MANNLGKIGGAIVGGVPGALIGKFGFDDPADQQDAQDELQTALGRARATSKQQQTDQWNSMQAPSFAPQMEARLKALESQSQDRPLIEDPYFQGQRAQLVNGGRAALSNVENRQSATHTQGGFSNVGSMNDIYDRLGGQLAQLGGQAQQLRDQKASTAAQARQGMLEAQTQFENSRKQAFAALAAGDGAAAQAALQNAFQAKQQIMQNQQAFFMSLANMGAKVGANAITGGAAAPATAAMDAGTDAIESSPGVLNAPAANSLQMPQLGSSLYQTPYALQRRQYGL